MCERKTTKYVCNRCSNFMHISTPREIKCQLKDEGICRGWLENIDVVKCEPALCTRCSSFPANSSLPFAGKPDVPPFAEHDVLRRFKALMNRKQDYYIRESSLQKTRKMYLAGDTDPVQELRNAIHNLRLSRWLTKSPKLMTIKEHANEARKELEDDPEDDTNEPKEAKEGSGDDSRNESDEDTEEVSNEESKEGPKAESKEE